MSVASFTKISIPVIVSAVLFSFCFNPFAPPTGVPDLDSSLRKTPEGVIKQLVNSYESMRLDLFSDLFGPTGEGFKYYIPLSAVENLTKLNQIALVEVIDTALPFIDSGTVFDYVTFGSEFEIHRNLFLADRITFIERLIPDSIEYIISRKVNDSVTSIDSLGFDTVAAVVRTREALLEISAEILEQTQGERTQDFNIGKQVFYMIRDPRDRNLWIISKWFELELL